MQQINAFNILSEIEFAISLPAKTTLRLNEMLLTMWTPISLNIEDCLGVSLKEMLFPKEIDTKYFLLSVREDEKYRFQLQSKFFNRL